MRYLRYALLGLLALAALVVGDAPPAAASAGATERVSVASDGTEGNGYSWNPAISGDGRFVAFESYTDNLVPGDTNEIWDVFVHDRQTGTTERVSVASDGTQGNDESSDPAISGAGRFVAFESPADNLVPGDTNEMWDVFVHDRQTGTTERVSVASDGTEGNDDSSAPAISADGRFVAFHSLADNLAPGDTNGLTDVFVHDRQTGTTKRVSVASDGTEGNETSAFPAISGAGRFVAFHSLADNLVTGDTNGEWDVFVHDRQTGTTERVSVASDGSQSNCYPYCDGRTPSISADGRFVAFLSRADDLVLGDTNEIWDVFVHDRQTGTTERVSVASDGTEGNNDSKTAAISADGRFVAFHSAADNLVPGDTNYGFEVFVHDRLSGETERVSVASDGSQGNGGSAQPAISGDGRFVAFASGADNLVPGDTNGAWDVFVRDRCPEGSCGGPPPPPPTPTPTPAPMPPPILLVHGSGGNCDSMANLRSFLQGNGYTRIDCFGYDSSGGGWWSAWNLKRFVDGPDGFKGRMGMTGGEEYYIVAHSFGGLVARYYAEEIGVSQLGGIIMLGTPNGGAPEACWVKLLRQDWWDMCPGSTFLSALNSGFNTLGRTYKGIAGTADNGRLVFNLVENDCIVYSWSVRGPLFNPLGFDIAKYNVRHATGFLCPGTANTLLNDTAVHGDIVNTLNGAAGIISASSSDAAVQSAAGPDVLPAVPLLLSSSGSLTSGSTATESVAVEGGLPSMTVRLIWPEDGGPAASLEVSRPDGTEVQATDSDVISWDSGAAGIAGLFIEQLVIDSPASGDWEVTVRAAASPSGSVPYIVQVQPESDVALQVEPIVSGKVGQAVQVSVTVLNGLNPMTPDSIMATATAPGGGSSPIALTDNGLGTYEGSFVPGECGTFTVAVSATASVGEVVTRYHEVQVDIGVDGDAGGDPCNPDEDGDEFDDGVELFIGTDPLAACPTVVGAHDAWPPDFDMNRSVDILDVGEIRLVFHTTVPPTSPRFDLKPDGDINILDVGELRLFYNLSCTP